MLEFYRSQCLSIRWQFKLCGYQRNQNCHRWLLAEAAITSYVGSWCSDSYLTFSNLRRIVFKLIISFQFYFHMCCSWFQCDRQIFSFFWIKFTLCMTGFVAEDSPYASSGQKGTYYFEFSRPLRSMDSLQQVVPAF